jgi:hypothetical protein
MAEFEIVVMPKDESFAPTPSAIATAVSLMEGFFPDRANEVAHQTSPRPRLVTSLDAFESLKCPRCGETVERFDLDEDGEGATWWDGFERRMRDSRDAGAEILEMPCCGAQVKAADIDMGADAGFARFTLSLYEAGDDNILSEAQESSLAKALGCEIRWMTAVYS